MREISQCRLYGILDLGYVETAAAPVMATRMLEAGIDVIQLRAKSETAETIGKLAEKIHPFTQAAGVPLVINDHPAIAARSGAEGVHLGQEDGPLEAARRAAPGAAVGRSTRSREQALAAAQEGADYIGFGPLFATPTKPDYPAIGLADIAWVHEKVDLPIFCIGGIKLENLQSVIDAGARRVVIVSGILQAENVAAYIRDAKALLPPIPS